MDIALTVENERLAELLTALRFENRQQSGLASDLVPGDTDAAYRVSREVSLRLGWNVGGWKIAAFKPEMQRRLRANAPIYGPVYKPQIHLSPMRLEGRRLLHPLVEVELVVRLSAPLPPRSSPSLRNDIEEAVGSIHPGLEIAECRFAHDDRFPPLNAILADGSGSGTLVLGEAIVGWRSHDFSAGHAALRVNGTQRREGRIFDAVEHPLAPLVWIANELSRVVVGLPAGVCVSTGSLTGMYLAKPGDELTGDLGPLGEVHAFVGE